MRELKIGLAFNSKDNRIPQETGYNPHHQAEDGKKNEYITKFFHHFLNLLRLSIIIHSMFLTLSCQEENHPKNHLERRWTLLSLFVIIQISKEKNAMLSSNEIQKGNSLLMDEVENKLKKIHALKRVEIEEDLKKKIRLYKKEAEEKINRIKEEIGNKMDVLNGIEEGATDYITKPFSQQVLIAKIKHILDSENGQRPSRHL